MSDKQPGQSSLLGPEKTACLFCRFINKEEESYVVFEDLETIAFLDSRPLFPGHIQLIPKKHYREINEIPESLIDRLFNNAKLLSDAVEKGMNADGSFIAINNKVSQSVPHLHIHIVPRKFRDGLKGFFWPRYSYKDKEEIAQVQARIIEALSNKTVTPEQPSSR